MTVLSSSLLSLKTARFSLKDSAKTLSSLFMFWASAPKRYKGKNIFGFDCTFCGDCLGNGLGRQSRWFHGSSFYTILDQWDLARAFLIDLIALSSDKNGLKCRLRVSFDTLRQRKRPQASPSITAQDRHCNKEVIDSGWFVTEGQSIDRMITAILITAMAWANPFWTVTSDPLWKNRPEAEHREFNIKLYN